MGKWATRCACWLLAALLCAGAVPLLGDPSGTAWADGAASRASAEQAQDAAGAAVGEGQEGRVVKVAFPEAEGMSMTAADGSRSGVIYDWLVEIAKYTGWSYEFVEGDVDDLVQRQQEGEIDLFGGMFYRDQLKDVLDYSRFSMGSNRSLLICPADDDSLAVFDVRTLEGKRVGAYRNAVEKIRRLESFLAFNGVSCEVVPLERDAYERCLDDGTADVMLVSDVEMRDDCKVVAEFDGEPHFVSAPKGSDLLPELDEAMKQIYAADPGFSSSLYARYFPETYPSPIAFSDADRAYVAQAPELRVAVVADRYPLYYQRGGSYQGVVKEVFGLVSSRTGLSFRFVPARTYAEALELVASGEADVVGCFMDDERAAGEQGFALTKRFASLDEVVFKSKLASQDDGRKVAAQIEGRSDGSLAEGAEVVTFPTYAECLEAVNSGRADFTCMPASYAESLFTSRAYGNVAPSTADHRETAFSAALPHPVDAALYSVLSKAMNSFTDEELGALLSRSTVPVGGQSQTLESLVSSNPLLVVSLALVFFVLVGAIAVVVVGSKMRSRMMALKLERAEETGRAKADFLSRMSHEIRTPMNAIIGLSNVATLSGEATPSIRSNLEKINTSAQFLLSLVNDILDMSKIENDKMRIEVAPLRLPALAERLESMFSIQAQEKGVALKVACGPDAVVMGDDVRLQQVLANLLSNAFKFTEAGGTVALGIDEVGRGDGSCALRFGVRDDGAGIRAEDLERIFVSFEQASGNHRNAQGTGLGLAISNNLVRLMGGRIEVRSRPGEGSEFFFVLELPLAEAEEAARLADGVADAAGADAAAGDLEGTRALLAEDNDLNAEIAVALLGMEGVSVDRAANGREAVELFAAAEPGRYDYVLMDVQMPVLDGLEAAARIRALDRPDARVVPIIALTANTFQEDRDEAKAAGMDGFIPKPFDARKLYDTLRGFLPPSP